MATVITAGNATNGLSFTADNTGSFQFKTGTGAGTTAITVDASQNVTFANDLTVSGTLTATGGVSGAITSGTAVASTSGTSIDFTGIPAGVKRVTVMFSGVSTNGTNVYLIQLGTSGSFATTGYVGSTGWANNAASSSTTSVTAGIGINNDNAGRAIYGSVSIVNVTSNTWIGSGSIGWNTTFIGGTGGGISLAGVLDSIRITTVGGTNTFDAGTINILYE